jgi:hypothetical protein
MRIEDCNRNRSDYKRLLVKNIVAKQFADWYEEGQLVCHIDGNK